MLQIRACKSGGIDTRVRGVSIIGRVDMNEDEIAANFSFLTVEDVARDPGLVRHRRKKEPEPGDVHTNKVSHQDSMTGLRTTFLLSSHLSSSVFTLSSFLYCLPSFIIHHIVTHP